MEKTEFQGPPTFTKIGIFGLKIFIPSGNPARNWRKEGEKKSTDELLFREKPNSVTDYFWREILS
jgi:hypothetical protein